jgi:hypothetical protein
MGASVYPKPRHLTGITTLADWEQSIPPRDSVVSGLVVLPQQSRVDVTRPSTLRDVAGHIPKGARFLTGRTPFGSRFGSKSVVTVTATPLCHGDYLPWGAEHSSHGLSIGQTSPILRTSMLSAN